MVAERCCLRRLVLLPILLLLLLPLLLCPPPASADLLSDYSVEQMLSMVPTQAPNDCKFVSRSPAIDYTQAGAPKIGEASIWTWTPSNPNVLTETYSATDFPSPSFATVKVAATSHSGKAVELTYTRGTFAGDISYNGVARSMTTDGVWLEGCLSAKKGFYFYRTLIAQLAASYDGSADKEVYAERVLLLLDKAADHHQNFVLRYHNSDLVVTPTQCAEDPWRKQPWYNCRLWSTYNGFAHELDWSSYLLSALQKVKASASAATLSATRGYDVVKHVQDNILVPEVEYTMKPGLSDYIKGNLLGWIQPFINIAIELVRLEDAKFVISFISAGVANVARDGMYLESYMYAQHAMAGYSEGITHCERFFEAYPPAVGSDSAAALADLLQLRHLFDRGHKELFQLQQPNGQWPANGDNTREGFEIGTAAEGHEGKFRAYKSGGGAATGGYMWLNSTRTNTGWLIPAYGGVALRAGAGTEDSQINMEPFQNGNYGHCSMQAGAIQLTAFGRALIDGKRYERTRQRQWHAATSSWSTVTINMTPQRKLGSSVPINATNDAYIAAGGQPRVFLDGADGSGISVVEMDGFRAYSPIASRYTRLTAHHARDPKHPYVLDVFRVKGGWHHEYTLHGSTQMNMDTTMASSSVVMTSLPKGSHPLLPAGATWSEPPQSFGFGSSDRRWYGMYDQVRKATLPKGGGTWQARFDARCDGKEHPSCAPGSAPPGLRVFHAGSADTPGADAPGAGADAVTEELIFAQDPHNYRYSSGSILANSLPVPETDYPMNGAGWRATIIQRRSLAGSADPPDAASAGPDGGLGSLFVYVLEPVKDRDPSVAAADPAAIATVHGRI